MSTTLNDVAKFWRCIDKNGQEYLSMSVNNGKEVVLTSGARFQICKNNQRQGINPESGKQYQDADYKLNIILPEKATPVKLEF